ncbi:uncharacterized protein [Hyperolius riggenbachi]|uniref:uncharacterized protein n=1 Tax=Hyperolius riggenbachi TaxID=752182 RepID=UPI0035A3BC34
MEPNAEHTACEEQAKRNIEEETLITHSVGHAGHTRENEEFIELSEMKPGELVTFSHNRKDLIKTSNNLCESKNHTEDSPNTVNCADTVVEATQHKEHEGRNYFTTTELETVTKLSSNQKDREIDLYQVEAPRAIDSVNSGGTTVHNEERDINGNHYQHLPKNSLVPPQKGKDNQPANNCTVSQDHEVDDLYQDVAPRATVSVNHGGSTVHTEEGKIYGNHDQHLPKNSLVPPHKGKAIQPMSNFVSQHKLQALIDKTNPSSVRMDGTLQNRDMEKKFEEIGSAAESVDLPKKFPINLGDHLEDKEDLSHTVIVRSIRGNPDKETSKYRRLKTKKQQTKLGNVPHTNKICSDLLRNTFRILWWFSGPMMWIYLFCCWPSGVQGIDGLYGIYTFCSTINVIGRPLEVKQNLAVLCMIPRAGIGVNVTCNKSQAFVTSEKCVALITVNTDARYYLEGAGGPLPAVGPEIVYSKAEALKRVVPNLPTTTPYLTSLTTPPPPQEPHVDIWFLWLLLPLLLLLILAWCCRRRLRELFTTPANGNTQSNSTGEQSTGDVVIEAERLNNGTAGSSPI